MVAINNLAHFTKTHADLVASTLTVFSESPNFDMTVMFMDDSDKKISKEVIEGLSNSTAKTNLIAKFMI